MKKIYLLSIGVLLLLLGCSYIVKAQGPGGIAVNTAGAQPDSSALLDLSSTIKGTLMTRMTTAQRDAIVNPAKGLTIFNTDCSVYNFNAGTPAAPNWATVTSSNALAAGVSITASPAGAICTGTSVTFSATPTQNNLSPVYQWQVNGSNAGSNSSTYTTDSLNNGDVVSCILSSSVACVTGSPATSNAIPMLINAVPTITGTTAAAFCSGSAVTLSATASLGAINWYLVSTGGSSLSTGASFTVSGLTATTTYYVDATANACTTASRTAVAATFYPNSPGQPGAISGPVQVSENDTATYSISALSNTASYTWTVTLGIITSGQGSNSIGVTWADSNVVGSIAVAANNPCGTSSAQSENIYIQSETFNVTGTLRNGSLQTFTVPRGVTSLTITAYGAQGGSGNGGYGSTSDNCNCSLPGGLGAEIIGTFTVTPGDAFNILVAQAGGGYGGPYGNENGGGGGSFVVDQTTNTLLIAAGGGGGGPSTNYGTGCSRTQSDANGQADNSGITPSCPQCGCSNAGGSGGSGGNSGNGNYPGGGGGGYISNGANGAEQCSQVAQGGLSYMNGGTGGLGDNCYDGTGTNNAGGYGGGGAGNLGGPGAGGGYSGGGTIGSWGSYSSYGGGGGSYNTGSNPTNTAGVQNGQGQVIISW